MNAMHRSRRRFLGGTLAAAGSAALAGAALAGCAATSARPRTQRDGASAAPEPAAAEGEAAASAAGAERFAALAGFCEGVDAPPAAEYAQRQERARALLSDAGYDALILEAGSNMRYFTGTRWWQSERPLLFLLPLRGAPVWIAPAFEAGSLRQLGVEGDLRLWHEHQSPYALAAQALAERGVGRAALGPELRNFVASGLRAASAALALGDGAAIASGCRMIKSTAELACLRRAGEATKAALSALAPALQPGMGQAEIQALTRAAQQAAGLTDVWVLALYGPEAAYPHGTRSERRLAEGDLVLIDTGGSLHGYRSDVTRTWALGQPSDEQRAVWQCVAEAQQAAMELIRPGVRCGAVDAAARARVAAAGYGGDYQSFTHRLGHGIGLDVHEEPYLVRDSERVLAPGMTMSNEPGIYLPGRFGVRIEDIVAVTETGVEVFGPRATSIAAP